MGTLVGGTAVASGSGTSVMSAVPTSVFTTSSTATVFTDDAVLAVTATGKRFHLVTNSTHSRWSATISPRCGMKFSSAPSAAQFFQRGEIKTGGVNSTVYNGCTHNQFTSMSTTLDSSSIGLSAPGNDFYLVIVTDWYVEFAVSGSYTFTPRWSDAVVGGAVALDARQLIVDVLG